MRAAWRATIGLASAPVLLAAAIATAALATGAPPPAASSLAPTVLEPVLRIGWESDRTTGENSCAAASGDLCLSRVAPSGLAGGFEYPSDVVVDPVSGRVYVADMANHRIQELTADGRFVSMFGRGVNATEDALRGSSQAQRDVCTAASRDRCRSGLPGSGADAISYPVSVAVDARTGDVYVLDVGLHEDRLVKYEGSGRFLWMAGRGVNEANGSNLCKRRELEAGVRCGAGAPAALGGSEPRAFRSPQFYGLLAVDGSRRRVYVGDEHRVQELGVNGRWLGELSLLSASAGDASAVSALALDGQGGLYLVYHAPSLSVDQRDDVVRRFSAAGLEVSQFTVLPRVAGAEALVDSIAVDPAGEVGVIGVEVGQGFARRFGFVYDGDAGTLVGEFTPPQDNDGITFDQRGDLYVAATDDQEVVVYAPTQAAGLLTAPTSCRLGGGPEQALECELDGGGTALGS